MAGFREVCRDLTRSLGLWGGTHPAPSFQGWRGIKARMFLFCRWQVYVWLVTQGGQPGVDGGTFPETVGQALRSL